MFAPIGKLARDIKGTTTVELALVGFLVFVFTFVIMETSLAFSQWLSAEKATDLGVRLAVVSDPIATELSAFDGKQADNRFGDPMPAFSATPVICDGANLSCSGGYTFDVVAFDRLVLQMNRAFGGAVLVRQNVVIQYEHIGLGFVGRPGGPVPAVTVRLQRLVFSFIVIDRLLGLGPITLPPFPATLVGEDLNHSSPVT